MSDPSIFRMPGGFRFIWPLEEVEIKVNRFSDDRRNLSTSAEVSVRCVNPAVQAHLHQGRVNFTSTTGKTDLVRALKLANESIDWHTLVEGLSTECLRLHREGEPVETIGEGRALGPGVRYRLWPFCPDGMASMIYGEGGTGKSMFALLASILVQSGATSIGLRPMQGNVLYLDYETSADIMNERCHAICHGMKIAMPQISYRYCYTPLSEDIEALQEIIDQKAISFIVIDSAGPACGGDPSDPELAIRMMNALRELKRAALLVDHVSKNDNGKPTPFGSVYKPNLARSVWYAKIATQYDQDHTEVAFFHKKVNFGPKQKPMGFALAYQRAGELLQSLTFQSTDPALSDDEEIAAQVPQGDRIMAAIRTKALTVKDIAEATGIKEGSVRKCLERQGERFTKLADGTIGLRTR